MCFVQQVFARAVGTAPPYGTVKVKAVNVPVKLHSATQDSIINPGDYLVADQNGVVCLPKDLAEEALPLMAAQVSADTKMAEAIREGMSFSDASKRFRSK